MLSFVFFIETRASKQASKQVLTKEVVFKVIHLSTLFLLSPLNAHSTVNL